MWKYTPTQIVGFWFSCSSIGWTWFFRFTSMAPHQQQSIFIVQLLISLSDHPRPNPGLSTHKRTTTIALDGRAAQEEDLVDVKRDQ